MTAIERRAARALERRFGRSVMPYLFRSSPAGTVKCIDQETGSWVIIKLRGARILVLDEFDAA